MQTSVVKNREGLLKLMNSDEKEVFSLVHANDEALYASWRLRDDAQQSCSTSNVVLASYTTAMTRLKLYSYMEKLQDRLLYCDTDSCIFLAKENDPYEYRPPIGTLLGDMTDELESYGEGSYIKTFACAGPKFYALEVVSGRTGDTRETVKVKGVTLNFLNSTKVNF